MTYCNTGESGLPNQCVIHNLQVAQYDIFFICRVPKEVAREI